MALFAEIFKSIVFGILEGITEWLPVSSTGHLILLEELLTFRISDDAVFHEEFSELFNVVIQLGAVSAVVLIYRKRLFSPLINPTERSGAIRLWTMIVIASIPAALAGTLLDELLERFTGRDMDGWLYTPTVVSAALILWGIFFIIAEKRQNDNKCVCSSVAEIPPRVALKIGVFQTFSLIPGTSRSGSTILGGMATGLNRTTAAEFSFFMAIPVMAGASLVKILGFAEYAVTLDTPIPPTAWILLAVGTLTAFVVSVAVIRFLTDFVKKHSFVGFAVYRMILGGAVLLFSLF